MRPACGWRDVPGLGDVTFCQPASLLATGPVEAGRDDPARRAPGADLVRLGARRGTADSMAGECVPSIVPPSPRGRPAQADGDQSSHRVEHGYAGFLDWDAVLDDGCPPFGSVNSPRRPRLAASSTSAVPMAASSVSFSASFVEPSKTVFGTASTAARIESSASFGNRSDVVCGCRSLGRATCSTKPNKARHDGRPGPTSVDRCVRRDRSADRRRGSVRHSSP